MRKHLLLIIILIWVVCIVISLNHWNFLTTSIDCHEKKIMEEYEFYGTVSKKYRDLENHGTKTLIINALGKSKNWKLYLLRENSDFYDSVNVNDTISKVRRSIVIKDISKNKEYQLLYNCIK